MRNSAIRFALLLLCTVSLTIGCTAKRGTIALETLPPGASVFVNGIKQGETPLTFEYDAGKPGTLKIEKEGYRTETEQINKAWFVNEHYRGNFIKTYEGAGENRKRVWSVRTTRELRKAE